MSLMAHFQPQTPGGRNPFCGRIASKADAISISGSHYPVAFSLPGAPRCDRGAALLVVAVDLHRLPHRIHVVGIAARERIDRGAVLGIDDEDAAHRRLAV